MRAYQCIFGNFQKIVSCKPGAMDNMLEILKITVPMEGDAESGG
jgi:hypothetical protein